MKRLFAAVMSVAVLATYATIGEAQSCPPEVATAKQMLAKRAGTAKAQQEPIQAPRSLAGARGYEAPRGQDSQAPRGQDSQAPRGQDSQAPRGQDSQAPRGQDSQAPRGQDSQAPRGQDSQAPRGQDSQAPRGQDSQAPRGQDSQAPRSLAGSKVSGTSAATLVREAEAACKAGDMTTAKAKAQAAINALK
ncbi:MAG TPA: hypothetical protein VNN07_18605 [Candidatus Tectomicrobia bacterium]|nr:hypothetical protein [Candidatus Tectomicrobia bacterium]